MTPSRDDLARAYGPLVRHVVASVTARRPNPADVDDLVAEGMMALVEALRRFDPSRSVAFSTFAFHRVRGAVKDGLRKIEPTTGRRARSASGHRSGPNPGGELSRPSPTPAREPDQLPDDHALRPDDVAARLEAYRRLAGAVAQLPDRERALIEAHYGEDLTLDAAGRRLGLSKSWSSRLHARAIDKLSRLLEDPEHAPPESDRRAPGQRGAK